ncbi:MAG: cytochrome c oxidase accessory protein CcoG [Vicingaceae bacterium]
MAEDSEGYRDSLATINADGGRKWIYPKKPKGAFFTKRKIVSYVLLIVLFGTPHVTINGLPLLLFNIIERKFIIFGKIFWPQDFFIFAVAMLTGIVFIALFTIVFGRIFCGWVCPQTIFMEMVFRRIEYIIEGDYKQQKQLDKQPWNANKIFKKTLKQGIFFGISFLIANTFLAYIIGADALWQIQTESPAEHIEGLVSLLIFSLVFYGVFAFMREQVCTTICPYGRLQGVLLDSKSIIVGYDYVRGEGRGKFRKNEDRKEAGKGDCIDCNQCVDVCPTGIDIRNGTQLECVNCTACIDACNFMMEKTGLEQGLIRLDSEEGIKNSVPFTWTKRTIFYSVVLVLLTVFLAALVITRKDFDATITRAKGTIQKSVGKNGMSNIYDVTLINKTTKNFVVTLKLLEEKGKIDVVKDQIELEEQSETKGKFVVTMDKGDIKHGKNKITIGIYGNGELIEKRTTIFMGPLL